MQVWGAYEGRNHRWEGRDPLFTGLRSNSFVAWSPWSLSTWGSAPLACLRATCLRNHNPLQLVSSQFGSGECVWLSVGLCSNRARFWGRIRIWKMHSWWWALHVYIIKHGLGNFRVRHGGFSFRTSEQFPGILRIFQQAVFDNHSTRILAILQGWPYSKPKWLFSTLKGCILKPFKLIEPPGFDLSDLIRSSESSGKDCYMDPWLKSQTPWRFLRGSPGGLLRLLLQFI